MATRREAQAYEQWRSTYEQIWRWAFDPIGLRITRSRQRVAADLTVMPLIAGSEYQPLIIERPYRFIPTHRGTWWPWWIQRMRLIDRWLRKSQGIVTWECRHAERLRDSLRAGHGIL